MDWLQVLSLFMANAGLIFWFRAEARADWRQMDTKIDAMVVENDKKIEALRLAIEAARVNTDQKIDAIHAEMRDFHGRLCAIEERGRR